MGAYLTNSGGASFNRDQDLGAAGQDYRRTRDDYGRAMRLLRKDSKFNPDSALKMIGLRNQARDQGIQIGGVRNAGSEMANAKGYSESMERMAGERAQEAAVNRALVGRAMGGNPLERGLDEPQEAGMTKRDISGRVIAPMRGSDAPATKDIGTKVLDTPPAPKKRLSFAEQDRVGREESTRSGAFGKLAQGRR
jgi:hypothetical protein